MEKRRSFFKKLTGITALLSVGFLNLRAMGKAKKINGRFIHMVFFWLKDSTNPDEFIKITEAFVEQIDEVNSFHVGKPAGTPREVVDNTYQVSLVVTFDSKEEQDVYQDHPIHVKYVEDNKEKWETVQIYDSWGEVYA
tara:strand:- start:1172 stop:1585 length:414 start_codon:yes stop_codon:yes gene_type:complete